MCHPQQATRAELFFKISDEDSLQRKNCKSCQYPLIIQIKWVNIIKNILVNKIWQTFCWFFVGKTYDINIAYFRYKTEKSQCNICSSAVVSTASMFQLKPIE